MYHSRYRRLRLRVVFDQAVEEGRVAAVADAVDVAARLGRVQWVEGGEFGRVCFRGDGYRDHLSRFDARWGYFRTADVGEFEASEGSLARFAFAVDVVQSSGCAPFHVVVVEALEDVEVRVGGDVGDDVGFPLLRLRGLLPCVDGVEGEEGIRFEHSHEALAMPSIDYEPEVLFVRFEFHGVQQVPRPENLGAAFGVVGVEYAENHVALRQEYRMKICRSDRTAGESGKNGGFPRLGGHGEDSIRCLPTDFEVVIVPISRDWVCAGVGACEGSLEVWVQFRLAHGIDRFEGRWVDALEGGVIGLEPEIADLWGRRVI